MISISRKSRKKRRNLNLPRIALTIIKMHKLAQMEEALAVVNAAT